MYIRPKTHADTFTQQENRGFSWCEGDVTHDGRKERQYVGVRLGQNDEGTFQRTDGNETLNQYHPRVFCY